MWQCPRLNPMKNCTMGFICCCVFTGHCVVNEHVCTCGFVPAEECYGGVCRLACHEARGTNPLAPRCRIQVK